MHFKKRDLFKNLVLTPVCVFLCAAAYAAPPTVRKVSTLPTLTPLPMSIGGRMLITPSAGAEGFGGKDYTSQWPGSYFRAAFEGSRVFFRVGQSDEILHIVVDGQSAAPLVKPVEGSYEIKGLSEATWWSAFLWRRRARRLLNTFGGFGIPAGRKARTPQPRHRHRLNLSAIHTPLAMEICRQRIPAQRTKCGPILMTHNPLVR